MAKAFALSESDQKILQQVIDAEKRVVRNTQQRPAVNIEDYYQSPDVYIAYTPEGGIPALNDQYTTGTGTSELDDIAGSAECDLYRLTELGATNEITPIGYSKKVYNLSTTAIAGWQWIPVIRDKFGIWLANPLPIEPSITITELVGQTVPSINTYVEVGGESSQINSLYFSNVYGLDVSFEPGVPGMATVRGKVAGELVPYGMVSNLLQVFGGDKYFQFLGMGTFSDAGYYQIGEGGYIVTSIRLGGNVGNYLDAPPSGALYSATEVTDGLGGALYYSARIMVRSAVLLEDESHQSMLSNSSRENEDGEKPCIFDIVHDGTARLSHSNNAIVTAYAVSHSSTLYIGATVVTNGITFKGGLYISGSVTAGGLTVGTSLVAGGTTGYLLYNNAGTLGNASLTTLGTAAGGITVTYP